MNDKKGSRPLMASTRWENFSYLREKTASWGKSRKVPLKGEEVGSFYNMAFTFGIQKIDTGPNENQSIG